MIYYYFQRISQISKKHPVLTLTLTNMGLATIADITAQTVAKFDSEFNIVSNESLDLIRLARFVLYQGTFAPICFKWYSLLDRAIPVKLKSVSDLSTNTQKFSTFQNVYKPVLKRVFADQLLFAPIAIGCFFSAITLLEGGNLSDIYQKINDKYVSTLLANWRVWPIFQFINFCYVPLFFRLPFASIMGIFWNTYLSLANSHAPIAASSIGN